MHPVLRDGIEVAGIELAQPGLHVTAQVEHLQIGPRLADLQAATQATVDGLMAELRAAEGLRFDFIGVIVFAAAPEPLSFAMRMLRHALLNSAVEPKLASMMPSSRCLSARTVQPVFITSKPPTASETSRSSGSTTRRCWWRSSCWKRG